MQIFVILEYKHANQMGFHCAERLNDLKYYNISKHGKNDCVCHELFKLRWQFGTDVCCWLWRKLATPKIDYEYGNERLCLLNCTIYICTEHDCVKFHNSRYIGNIKCKHKSWLWWLQLVCLCVYTYMKWGLKNVAQIFHCLNFIGTQSIHMLTCSHLRLTESQQLDVIALH